MAPVDRANDLDRLFYRTGATVSDGTHIARIAISAAPALMVAIGVTFIIVMESIDLSMEGTGSVSAIVFAAAFIALGGTIAGAGILALPLLHDNGAKP